MPKCPECKQEVTEYPCVASGCGTPAEYEGWARNKDGFGVPTGLCVKVQVCKAHMNILIGHIGSKEVESVNIINNFKSPAYSFLSNFYRSPFEFDKRTWDTVEHAYQAMKTYDSSEQFKIQMAPTPAAAKRLGKTIHLRSDWNDVRVVIMGGLVLRKFRQDSIIRQQLLDTENAHLVEGNNWGDTYWGQCNGIGENWLGKILMETRAILRKEKQS